MAFVYEDEGDGINLTPTDVGSMFGGSSVQLKFGEASLHYMPHVFAFSEVSMQQKIREDANKEAVRAALDEKGVAEGIYNSENRTVARDLERVIEKFLETLPDKVAENLKWIDELGGGGESETLLWQALIELELTTQETDELALYE